MRQLTPSPPSHHGQRPSKVPENLGSTGFVYIRRDDHRGPLERPYKGPYRIIETAEKFYTVDVDGHLEKISIDRLKAAYVTVSRVIKPLKTKPF